MDSRIIRAALETRKTVRNPSWTDFPVIKCTTEFSQYTSSKILFSPVSAISVPIAPNTFMNNPTLRQLLSSDCFPVHQQ